MAAGSQLASFCLRDNIWHLALSSTQPSPLCPLHTPSCKPQQGPHGHRLLPSRGTGLGCQPTPQHRGAPPVLPVSPCRAPSSTQLPLEKATWRWTQPPLPTGDTAGCPKDHPPGSWHVHPAMDSQHQHTLDHHPGQHLPHQHREQQPLCRDTKSVLTGGHRPGTCPELGSLTSSRHHCCLPGKGHRWLPWVPAELGLLHSSPGCSSPGCCTGQGDADTGMCSASGCGRGLCQAGSCEGEVSTDGPNPTAPPALPWGAPDLHPIGWSCLDGSLLCHLSLTQSPVSILGNATRLAPPAQGSPAGTGWLQGVPRGRQWLACGKATSRHSPCACQILLDPNELRAWTAGHMPAPLPQALG